VRICMSRKMPKSDLHIMTWLNLGILNVDRSRFSYQAAMDNRKRCTALRLVRIDSGRSRWRMMCQNLAKTCGSHMSSTACTVTWSIFFFLSARFYVGKSNSALILDGMCRKRTVSRRHIYLIWAIALTCRLCFYVCMSLSRPHLAT